MFEPESIAGMLLGLAIIGGATFILVREHLARERDDAETADGIDAPPPRDTGASDR